MGEDGTQTVIESEQKDQSLKYNYCSLTIFAIATIQW